MQSQSELKLILIFLLINIYSLHGLEAPSVHLPNQGIVIGTYLKMFRTQNIKAYLGIEYAKASRFSPPEMKINKWNMVYNASSFGPRCWQRTKETIKEDYKSTVHIRQLLMTANGSHDGNRYNFDEDCLYLNIFIPNGSPGLHGYAVMVWFHGGDFSSGSPMDIDPFQMVFKQKVIVITVAYRLSILGFLTTGDAEAPGNFGLMDQSAALLWIRKNIGHFGGNAEEITIIGHSAGSISVGLHLTSNDWSKNAFHKAILMSGNPLSDNIVKNFDFYNNHLDIVSETFGCNRKPTSMLLKCLKRLDAKILMDNIPNVEWGPVIDRGFSNISKGFIEDSPNELFKNGNYHKVPIIIGITDMEDVLQLLDNESIQDGQMTSESFDSFIKKLISIDVQIFNDSNLWCNDFSIITDSINMLYKSMGDMNLYRIINDYVNLQTDRMHLAPLFMLSNLLSFNNNVYVYYFNIRPKTEFYNLTDWISVPKYFDQIFIWGVPYMDNNVFINRWNSTDKKISEIVMTLWANFAKSSNPTAFNIYLKWNAFEMNNQSYLVINEDFQIQTAEKNYKINFWNNYYPNLLQFTTKCCSLQNHASVVLPSGFILLTLLIKLN